MVSLIIISGLLISLGYLLNKFTSVNLLEFLEKDRIKYASLLTWIIVGFFFGLDYTIDSGCIPISVPIFGLKSLLFSSISCVLVLASFFIKKRSLKVVSILIELMYWVTKLLFIKGGYATGFGGDPLSTVVTYDLLAVFFRLLLLRTILADKINKPKLIIALSIIIIAVKILFFAMPIYYQYKKSSDEFLEFMENKLPTARS